MFSCKDFRQAFRDNLNIFSKFLVFRLVSKKSYRQNDWWPLQNAGASVSARLETTIRKCGSWGPTVPRASSVFPTEWEQIIWFRYSGGFAVSEICHKSFKKSTVCPPNLVLKFVWCNFPPSLYSKQRHLFHRSQISTKHLWFLPFITHTDAYTRAYAYSFLCLCIFMCV